MQLREVFQAPATRRLLGLALLCGLILLGGHLLVRTPTKVVVFYEVGDASRDLSGLTVTYRRYGDGGIEAPDNIVVRKRYNFRHARSPREVRHQLRIMSGRYRVDAMLERTGGAQRVSREVEVRSDGDVLRVDLGGSPPPPGASKGPLPPPATAPTAAPASQL